LRGSGDGPQRRREDRGALRGRGGADSFVFDTAPAAGNLDRIVDFTPGSDKLHLAGSVFGLGAGPLAAGALQAGAVALEADDRLLYDRTDGSLYLDLDGDGAGAAIRFAILENTAALTAADILIF